MIDTWKGFLISNKKTVEDEKSKIADKRKSKGINEEKDSSSNPKGSNKSGYNYTKLKEGNIKKNE